MYGVVIYAGHDTKLVKNSGKSGLEINHSLVIAFLLQKGKQNSKEHISTI